MAAVAYVDILENPPRFTWDRSGKSVTRTWIIDFGDAMTPSFDMANINTVLPVARGDVHPTNTGMWCDTIEVEAFESSKLKVTAAYRRMSGATGEPNNSAAPLVSCGSSVQEGDVALDANGDVMVVEYHKDDDSSNPLLTRNVIATIQRPNFVLRCTRRETAAPTAKSVAYTGYLNNGVFYGGAAGTMLCTRIEGTSQDEGGSWVVEYEFQYNPTGWKFGAYYLDENGNIPDDSTIHPSAPGVTGNGYGVFTVYGSVDFGSLNL